MEELLSSRLDDLFRAAEKGRTAAGDFLDPEEQYEAARLAQAWDGVCGYAFFGGCRGTERQALIVWPLWDEPDEEAMSAMIRTVRIAGSGFEELTHRAVMGSVLGLGIERRAVGDIVMNGPHEALLFTSPAIARFLCGDDTGRAALERVGRDTVKVSSVTLPPDYEIRRAFEEVSGTVASPRLDAMTAELSSFSREKAQEAVRQGTVRLNYTVCCENDRPVAAGDVIAIRGIGKFRLDEIGGETRKGRIRFRASKYV